MILHGFSLKFKYTEVYKEPASTIFLSKLFFLNKGSSVVTYADCTKIQFNIYTFSFSLGQQNLSKMLSQQ